MNRAIMELTVRQILGAKRTLLLVAFALIPVLVAILFRTTGRDTKLDEWTANTLYAGLIATTLLPLVALVFGTAALGSEFEDGTAVYILARPIPRWTIVVSKLTVAATATVALVLFSSILSGIVASGGAGSIVSGFSIALAAGAVVYCCLFVCLSIVTSRALIAGLIYVFLWEGVITSLFSGLQVFSVRQYVLGLADRIISTNPATFSARLNGIEGGILMVAVAAVAVIIAVRRLKVWEIGESS